MRESEYVFPESLFVVAARGKLVMQRLAVQDDRLSVRVECVPIFSEQLLAERFIEAQMLTDADNVTMGQLTLHEAANYLMGLPSKGIDATHVVMDPTPDATRAEWIWTVAEAIARLDGCSSPA